MADRRYSEEEVTAIFERAAEAQQMGLGMFGFGALRLPGWASLRRRQMEGVAARLALAEGPAAPDRLPGEGS
jgi:hypothetical protein